MNKKLNELEGRIGYRFSDRQLLTLSLIHIYHHLYSDRGLLCQPEVLGVLLG